MVKIYALINYYYLFPKRKRERVMGYFLSREDVNVWKKSQTFKGEYKMKTVEMDVSEDELESYTIGLTPLFQQLYDVL